MFSNELVGCRQHSYDQHSRSTKTPVLRMKKLPGVFPPELLLNPPALGNGLKTIVQQSGSKGLVDRHAPAHDLCNGRATIIADPHISGLVDSD